MSQDMDYAERIARYETMWRLYHDCSVSFPEAMRRHYATFQEGLDAMRQRREQEARAGLALIFGGPDA